MFNDSLGESQLLIKYTQPCLDHVDAFTELNEKHGWYKYSYARTFPLRIDDIKARDHIPRISEQDMSPAAFIDKYEKHYIPTVISDSQKDWLANKKWTKEVCLYLVL